MLKEKISAAVGALAFLALFGGMVKVVLISGTMNISFAGFSAAR